MKNNNLTFAEKRNSFALFNFREEGILIENNNRDYLLSKDFTLFNAVLFRTEEDAYKFIEENNFSALEPFKFSEVMEDAINF